MADKSLPQVIAAVLDSFALVREYRSSRSSARVPNPCERERFSPGAMQRRTRTDELLEHLNGTFISCSERNRRGTVRRRVRIEALSAKENDEHWISDVSSQNVSPRQAMVAYDKGLWHGRARRLQQAI